MADEDGEMHASGWVIGPDFNAMMQHQHDQAVHAHMATNSRTADLRRFLLADTDRDGLTSIYYLMSSLVDMPPEERIACASHYAGVILAVLELRFGVSMMDLMTDEERMEQQLGGDDEDGSEDAG